MDKHDLQSFSSVINKNSAASIDIDEDRKDGESYTDPNSKEVSHN